MTRKARIAFAKYRVVMDGPYTHIERTPDESENEIDNMEYFLTFAEAKRHTAESLRIYYELYRSALRDMQSLRKSDIG